MTDHATPNLPAIDMDATLAFYERLGFSAGWKDGGWMILKRGALMIEFFPMPKLKPKESWFSACLRLDDLDAFHGVCMAAGMPDDDRSMPRCGKPRVEASGIRIFYMIDNNGSLIRCIENDRPGD